jgi:hypothetical protein
MHGQVHLFWCDASFEENFSSGLNGCPGMEVRVPAPAIEIPMAPQSGTEA